MANLSLTVPHIRTCSFRYAPPGEETAMPPAGFLTALEFLERSGVSEVRLLGGEPALHPDFAWMLARALERGFSVLVYSGGLIPNAVLQKLERLPAHKVTVLVEVAVPGESPPHEVGRQTHVFTRLGPRVLLGLTIRAPTFESDFLLELIERHGLARRVRLRLAEPGLGDDSAEMGRRVAVFGRRAREALVRVEFDCGWVPDLFAGGGMEDLRPGAPQDGTCCGPSLDVLPNGQVICRAPRCCT